MGEYEFCKDDWKIAARNIFICIIGVVIITPLMVVFGFISGLKAIMYSFYKYATDIDTSSWIDFASPVLSIALIGLLIWYVISLTKFKNNHISEHAAASIATIRNCIIVQLSGLLLMFVSMVLPVVGAILSVIWIIALIVIQFIMKEAYRTLSEEETWSAVARRGASQLKTSASYTSAPT